MIKYFLMVGWWNADAGIFYHHYHPIPVRIRVGFPHSQFRSRECIFLNFPVQTHGYTASFGRVFNGIGQQVVDHLFHHVPVEIQFQVPDHIFKIHFYSFGSSHGFKIGQSQPEKMTDGLPADL